MPRGGAAIGPGVKKTILIYALALAAGTFVLQWIEYRYLLHRLPGSWVVGTVALGLIGLGIWLGLSFRRTPTTRFERNDRALASLHISTREFAVLELLARGQTNKEIARSLEISPNTVKTHVAHLYEKLGASRRTEAVNKSRELRLIP